MQDERRKLKVLIVEDNAYEREILQKFVYSLDIIKEVSAVCDGSQAIEYLKSNEYDLLILDFVMQNKDGLEVLEFINTRKQKNRPKTIMVSAVGKSEIIKKAFDSGLDYYFKKSFNFKHLERVINDLFKRKNNQSKDFQIDQILRKLGIPTNLIGLKYINQILRLLKSENLTISEAYREIAKTNNTSYGCVESNVRNAIKSAHRLYNNYYSKFFDISKSDRRPKNSIFFHTILIKYFTKHSIGY